MYIIGWFWDEGYDFINAQGEHIKGTTRKALVLDLDAAGNVVRNHVVKVAASCPLLPCGEMVEDIFYDNFGKLKAVKQ